VLPVLTHALHYATCCIEGIRTDPHPDGWSVLQLTPHLQRLERNARLIGLAPPSAMQMRDAIVDLLRATPWRTAGYLRPLIFQAGNSLGPVVRPADTAFTCIHRPLPRRPITGPGLRLLISSLRHVDESAVSARLKASAGYLTAALARAEATRAGCDDAILLDNLGQVAEASAANLILVRSGGLVVPGFGTALLEGLTQQPILAAARRLGLSVQERPVARGELACAAEILLCSTAMELSWAGWLDGLALPHGSHGPGPVATRLLEAWGAERLAATELVGVGDA
jgi:branched-chain amino acid aminotransferase